MSSYGYTFNNPSSAMMNTFMWDQINKRSALKVGLRKKGYTDTQLANMTNDELLRAHGKAKITPKGSSSKTSAPTASKATAVAPTAPVTTKFRPSGKRILMPQIVASLTQDKEQQKVLTKLFTDSFDVYEKEALAKGFENDVAGAIAYFTYVAFTLQGSEPTEKGIEALALGLREGLGDKYATVSNTDKQNFYEFMVTMASFLYLSSMDATPEFLTQLKDVSAQVCQKFISLDVTKYNLTDDGLIDK